VQSQFNTKDLETLRYFLGIKVDLLQASTYHRKYILDETVFLDLFVEMGLSGAKPVNNLMDPNFKLYVDKSGFVDDPGRYR